ncbi:MAG: uroporphyrinogen decarboxylase family protein [Terriglobia bacterium]|jgi:uroporphyrinogen decarboxylase
MQFSRRDFLSVTASTLIARTNLPAETRMSSRERVDHALAGRDVDRPPFSFWHHFELQKEPPERLVQATLDFHARFKTDLVKVMSDFPYPKPEGQWYGLREEANPFPAQIQALNSIGQSLGHRAYFLETIFNPWKVAENLSSPQKIMRLKEEQPQRLLDALEVITKSEANHARRAVEAGASGIFLAIANAQDGILSQDDYAKFSEPFDRRILEATAQAPLNTLHLHGDKVYLDRFYKGWAASVINYSVQGTQVPMSNVRQKYSGVLMGGLDEVCFRSLSAETLRSQYESARKEAGKRFILAPGCSVPNDSTDAELLRVPQFLGLV